MSVQVNGIIYNEEKYIADSLRDEIGSSKTKQSYADILAKDGKTCSDELKNDMLGKCYPPVSLGIKMKNADQTDKSDEQLQSETMCQKSCMAECKLESDIETYKKQKSDCKCSTG